MTNTTVRINNWLNPLIILFDPPDCRDNYESFDFWNCDIIKVVDQETKEDISDRLNYDDYQEIYKRIYFETDGV